MALSMDALEKEYSDFCAEHNLPHESADELLFRDAAMPHFNWILDFIERWDTHQDKVDAAR